MIEEFWIGASAEEQETWITVLFMQLDISTLVLQLENYYNNDKMSIYFDFLINTMRRWFTEILQQTMEPPNLSVLGQKWLLHCFWHEITDFHGNTPEEYLSLSSKYGWNKSMHVVI